MDTIQRPKLPKTLNLLTDALIVYVAAYTLLMVSTLWGIYKDSGFTISFGTTQMLVGFFNALLMLVILAYLRKALVNIQRNHYFNHKNVDTLRTLSIITISGGIVITLLHASAVLYSCISNNSSYFLIIYTIKWKTIFFGLIILLMAESFKTGEHLQTEQNLTI